MVGDELGQVYALTQTIKYKMINAARDTVEDMASFEMGIPLSWPAF